MVVDKAKLKEIFGFVDPKLKTQAKGSSVVKSKDERMLEYFKSTFSKKGLEECQIVDPETEEVSLEFNPNSKTGHMTEAHAAIAIALQTTFASKVCTSADASPYTQRVCFSPKFVCQTLSRSGRAATSMFGISQRRTGSGFRAS